MDDWLDGFSAAGMFSDMKVKRGMTQNTEPYEATNDTSFPWVGELHQP
jgi:hypothetical protein